MIRYNVADMYFEWLYELLCKDRYSEDISYRKLLAHLHKTVFLYTIPLDSNRASDGVYLRYRFIKDRNYGSRLRDESEINELLQKECSVLEMMVALAIRCEESIMDDPRKGNRTTQWFWGMIVSLGLGAMTDDRYDKEVVNDILERFMERKYERNGKGGLFTVRSCKSDLRKMEIWKQLHCYLKTLM